MSQERKHGCGNCHRPIERLEDVPEEQPGGFRMFFMLCQL